MTFIRDNATLDIHKVHVPRGLIAVVIYPHVQVLTRDSRNILSDSVTLKQTVQQTGNLGGLLLGMNNSDLDLIKRSLNDVIIEPQRAQLIPHFYDVKEAALKEDALGCSISGAGPSIFALCANTFIAENVGNAMQKILVDNKIENDLFISPINHEGAIRL